MRRALIGSGLWLDLGALTLRVQSDSEHLANQLRVPYGDFPFTESSEWADLHVQVRRARGWRRWIKPQVRFRCDGQQPFEAFPADSPLPLFEWGCNWLIGRRLNDLLLFHAGALERDGLVLLLPAMPGSGKSTLAAALSLRGWRLMSDEFGAFDPDSEVFISVLKPIALKNRSIDIIQGFAPRAPIGSRFPKTRKGTVAHLGPGPDAVSRRHQSARAGAVVLPKWVEGSVTSWETVPEQTLFSILAFNAFNYGVLGETAYKAALNLAKCCPAWQLIYSDLEDALAKIDSVWTQVRDRANLPAVGCPS